MKKRTITLTDRAPVTIVEDNWPVIAQAKDWDNTHEFQANRTWTLAVRQHRDGRSIVYGVYSTAFQGESNARAGELITPPNGTIISETEWWTGPELVAAIRRVGEYLGFDRRLIDQCIGDLPAEELNGDDHEAASSHGTTTATA